MRFFADETDNTVTCALDMPLRDGGVSAEVALEAMERVVSIVEDGYDQLKVYQ